jgi:hypothetical protein
MSIEPVVVLKLYKDDACHDHVIYINPIGNKLYARVKPEFEDKRLITIIGQITGDAFLEYSANRLDEDTIKSAKQYIYKRVEKACEKNELLKQYKARAKKVKVGE